MKKLLTGLWVLALGACSLGPAQKDGPAVYDFGFAAGKPAGAVKMRASFLLHNVAAPPWLDTSNIVYRLGYQDGARHAVYTASRWAASPAALLSARLRSELAQASQGGVISAGDGVRTDYTLRVELDDFSQIFDSASASRGVIVARASIVDVSRRSLQAQKQFTIERPAVTPDAEGGVRALSAASDELVAAVVAWTAANIAGESK